MGFYAEFLRMDKVEGPVMLKMVKKNYEKKSRLCTLFFRAMLL